MSNSKTKILQSKFTMPEETEEDSDSGSDGEAGEESEGEKSYSKIDAAFLS